MDEDFSTLIILVFMIGGILLGLACKALADSSQANDGQGAAIADTEKGEAVMPMDCNLPPVLNAQKRLFCCRSRQLFP